MYKLTLGSTASTDSSSLSSLNKKPSTPKSWQSNRPKPPRPDRANVIFESIQNGLRECINLTQGDITLLQESIENSLSFSSAQQCKNGERYLKRLEFELAKLEELKDQYDVHLKMREGVRSMAYAYTLSSGPERDSALSSVRSGYKECTETLCFLESRLESMMGTFLLQMKGIQGFARLCPGDVFEITIKHGDSQKWKTRGKIQKNSNQQWDNQQTIMKALIEEKLSIKAVEVRGLGKNVTLGVKTCETKDLFSARPQLMTINLNSVGTLKLNLIITWNPLHTSSTDSIGPCSTLTRSFHQSSSSLLRIGSSMTLPALFSPSSYSKAKLNRTLPPPRITEIIDADYYIHRSPSNQLSSTGTASSTGSSSVSSRGGDCQLTVNGDGCTSSSGTNLGHNSQGATLASTSTSSGSRGSSLHLTVTSGFGSASGSASSYCGSTSVPNSTLTSPETEIPPNSNSYQHQSTNQTNGHHNHNNNNIENHSVPDGPHHINSSLRPIKCSTSINNLCLKQTTEKLLKEMGKSSQEIIVEATVHQSSSSLQTQATKSESNASLYSDRGTSSAFSVNCNHQNLHQRHLVSAYSLANVYFNVSDILLNLMSSLEDIQGQYSEIHSLQQSVLELYRILKNISRLRGTVFCNNNTQNNSGSVDKRQRPTTSSGRRSERNERYRRLAASTSDISLSVEDALECFDFLENADSDPESSPEASASTTPRKYEAIKQAKWKRAQQQSSLSVTGRLGSPSNGPSTNGSPLTPRCQKLLNNPHSISMTTLSSSATGSTPTSPIDSPQPLSSGSEQLDICLMAHLNYCQRLLQNLGSFGPLRMREKRSLEKLTCQGMVIHRLARLCSNLCEYFLACSSFIRREEIDARDGMKWLEARYQTKQEEELAILREDSRIRKLWDTVCYQNVSINSEEIGSMLLCVTSGQFAQTLESYMRAFLTPSPSGHSSSRSKLSSNGTNAGLSMYKKVSQLITSRIIDSPLFEDDYVVTIFQVAMFFRQENCSLEYLFKSYAEEISLLESLSTDNPVTLKQSLNRFRKTLPPQEPLFNIALLLLDRDPLVVGIAETYFNECAQNKSIRAELLDHFIEGLEVDSRFVRQASCKVLKLLKATEYMKQLAYISLADDCAEVCEQAKAALLSCGSLGRKMYEDSQLFAHGFHRMTVK